MILERKIRCVVFLPSMNDGGAEKVFSELCNYLFFKKYDINLVLGDSVGENLRRLNKSIKIVDLKTKKISRSIPKLVNFLLRNKHVINESSQRTYKKINVLHKTIRRSDKLRF